ENHAELAESLSMVPRVQGPGVIDMQQAILKRLRSEIDRLKNERTEIIANSKQNQIVQNRIQAAVISIIQATTFEKMIHVVTHELPELLDVDFITLAIEANADAPKRVPVSGVYVLAPGAIDAAIGLDKHARLRSHIAGEEAFFGDVARFVKSDVLMRLKVSSGSPDGIMCFGSRNPEAFGPGMAAELAHSGMARSSTARAFSSLRSFFRFLDKRGLAHNASIAAIQTPKLPRSVPKALSEKDMDELLDTPAEQEREAWIDLRDTAVLLLLYGAGLRIGEALGLAKGTVEELLKSGRDTLNITGKGNKERLVPLLPQAIEALGAYRDACPSLKALGPGDAFFLGARGGPLD